MPEVPASDVLVLTGPTTSGKTALAVELAEVLGGEVISADSRQVYRGMDIGTDKVNLQARARVPHHGLDLVNPDERYSAGRFQRDATRVISGVLARGRVPIVAGGTGFFLKALSQPLFNEPPMDATRRGRLTRCLETWDRDRLVRAVRVLDPERAPVAEEGGRHRLMRATEVALLTGVPLSQWYRDVPGARAPFRLFEVVLEVPREVLDQRIRERVGRMVERGFVAEVERLLAAGYSATDPGMSGTGYRDIISYLDERVTLDEALESMRLQTRQYARRQLTWFRHQMPAAPRVGSESLVERVEAIQGIWGERG